MIQIKPGLDLIQFQNSILVLNNTFSIFDPKSDWIVDKLVPVLSQDYISSVVLDPPGGAGETGGLGFHSGPASCMNQPLTDRHSVFLLFTVLFVSSLPFSLEDSAHVQDHYTLLERQIIIEVRTSSSLNPE